MNENIRENNPEIRRQALKNKFENSKQKKQRNLSCKGKNTENYADPIIKNIEFFDFKIVSNNFQKPKNMKSQNKKDSENKTNFNINLKKYMEDNYQEIVENKHSFKGYCHSRKETKISIGNSIEVKQQTIDKLNKLKENKNKIRKSEALDDKTDERNIIIKRISHQVMNKISKEAKRENIIENNKESHISTEEFNNFNYKNLESTIDMNLKYLKNSVMEENGVINYTNDQRNVNLKTKNYENDLKQMDFQMHPEKLENKKEKKTKRKMNGFLSFFRLCFS